jgi:hypothetical protein
MTIWGRIVALHNTTFYFNISLLNEEESKAALLKAWKGDAPFPSKDFDWPAWQEAAIDRITKCNASFAKRKNKPKGPAYGHSNKEFNWLRSSSDETQPMKR